MKLIEALQQLYPGDTLVAHMAAHPETKEVLLPVVANSTLELEAVQRMVQGADKQTVLKVRKQVGKQKLGFYDGRD